MRSILSACAALRVVARARATVVPACTNLRWFSNVVEPEIGAALHAESTAEERRNYYIALKARADAGDEEAMLMYKQHLEEQKQKRQQRKALAAAGDVDAKQKMEEEQAYGRRRRNELNQRIADGEEDAIRLRESQLEATRKWRRLVSEDPSALGVSAWQQWYRKIKQQASQGDEVAINQLQRLRESKAEYRRKRAQHKSQGEDYIPDRSVYRCGLCGKTGHNARACISEQEEETSE